MGMWDSFSGMFGDKGSLATGTGNFGGGNPASNTDGTDNAFKGSGSILGMSPNSFSAIAGGLGSALSKTERGAETPMSRIGDFARGLGVAQMGMIAGKEKAKKDQDILLQMIKQGLLDPGLLQKLIGQDSSLPVNGNNTPDGFPNIELKKTNPLPQGS